MTGAGHAVYPPAAAPSLHDLLRAGTTPEHRDLECALNLLRAGFRLEDYRRLLVHYHGFYLPFERFLQDSAGRQSTVARFYCGGRRKLSWLEQDLRALGVAVAPYAAYMAEQRFPALFPSEEHILGAIYVIEGSMLGGAVLSKHFRKHLQIEAETGLRFFSGYGPESREKWLETLQFLESRDPGGPLRIHALDGARRMFVLLRQHLVDAPA